MQISLERTGGFAGLSRTTTVDTANIPADKANQLSQILETANFFKLPTYIPGNISQPDRFQYTFTVENNGQNHTVTVSEAAITGSLKSLLEWIQSVA
ncbi:protealysin inhibitor emfourin [Calothrix sp. PCC 6303]|uniref:protealysin inhibitor emfourin n=1 Tax=Calothrix sp. PCC 6303 TaxID=1170562 RepID=UPI0002A01910|nr:protealysin inhibitor emfourin [Calothrix sp. PCC 6303]AFZ02106.1 hypothetical protein Cal6303_3164 [Calothrix sp. PCC 6303]